MMMSFCKKSVHSFLGFTNSKDSIGAAESPGHYCNKISSPASCPFITLSDEIQRPANVIESAAVKSPPSSPATTNIITTVVSPTKRDLGGIGFLDDVGGSVDGLMSCTESLGFESSDERRIDNQIENMNKDDQLCLKTTPSVRSRWKKIVEKNKVKKFPPPLSSLNHDGKPNFFLRPVRKDGRLELTEVKIDRPEILRASRQDGRLRLHLIIDEDMDVEEQAESNEEEEEYQEEEEEEVEEKIVEEDKEQVEEEKTGEWWLRAANGGGDGVRRCHEMRSPRWVDVSLANFGGNVGDDGVLRCWQRKGSLCLRH
ncbi:hypothetical protein F0562_029382 [Nyssa sinensis]|uniref:FAF domain-containing protein n=1 Tax=Nyssa sinensis TaxID=561372 RepID=A0A5J5B2U2_9ASTE|nr:hypothetical protein F0562_029382 [Nyssa sinensis]